MRDEGQAAAEAASPVRVPGEADAPAEPLGAEVEVVGGTGKSRHGRAASPLPSTGSDAPHLPGAPQAPLCAGQGVADAPVAGQGHFVEAGTRRARICPPLWKVCV